MELLELFWQNVEYYMQVKDLTYTKIMGGNATMARQHTYNPSLKKVQEIAEILGVSSYAVLFRKPK